MMDKEYAPEQTEVTHANALERLREFTGKDNHIDINNVITILADFKTELIKASGIDIRKEAITLLRKNLRFFSKGHSDCLADEICEFFEKYNISEFEGG